MKDFYSHGKLMITGEYLVLNGAKALAVPLKVGQKMEVKSDNSNKAVLWESYYNNKCWFEAIIYPDSLLIKSTNGKVHEKYVQNLLQAARNLNPGFLADGKTGSIKNTLEFSPEWGLGSSSTLISNVARLAEIDPFDLNHTVSKGSGYDIACAMNEMPILFSHQNGSRVINTVRFNPIFSDNLYLVWLGNKKPTEENILWYQYKIHHTKKQVKQITNITNEIWQTNDLTSFCELLKEHNAIMEEVLDLPQVQKQLFDDFNGVIKPLGAWGGDFVLVASEMEFFDVKSYFAGKGLHVLFRWDELVN